MKLKPIGPIAICLLTLAAGGFAQNVRAPNEFQLTRITKNLVPTPEYRYGGGEELTAQGERKLWLVVEAEFLAIPEFTDELTFKYFILFNGRLFTGEVTHVNIVAARENHSVMYIPPVILERFNNNRPLVAGSVQNVAVQIVQGGAVKSELSLLRAPPQWFAAIKGISGFVLNKNETPFAPLNWDRYPQIKMH